ncbi:MAG: hypothetical protein ACREO8_14185, partial [Luteimonas sp.]
MPAPADQSLQLLYGFAERWLGRELDDQERSRLAELASAFAVPQVPDAASQQQRASRLIDT